jgi:hypothetical protein
VFQKNLFRLEVENFLLRLGENKKSQIGLLGAGMDSDRRLFIIIIISFDVGCYDTVF